MTRPPLLEIEDLVVSFTTRRGVFEAVRGVSLHVDPGETLGIVGESGSGKSVTMQAVMGLIEAPGAIERGAMRWNGEPLSGTRHGPRAAIAGREIAMVFQDAMTSLNPLLTVGVQITEVLKRHKGLRAAAASARASELLRLVGITNPEGRLHYLPHQFSGGMRQRIMIAMALAAEPALLIADEPTTALDVTIQAQIVDLLAELRDRLRLSVVLVTHDMGLVAELCDRVAVMYAGRIVETAPVHALFAAPAHPYTAGLLRSMPRLDGSAERLEAIDGSPPDPSDLPEGCAFRTRCPHAQDDCIRDPLTTDLGSGRGVACWHPLAPPVAQRQEARVHAGE